MSAFKTLQSVSNNFEAELLQVSEVLHSAKIKRSFEDCISEKMKEMLLFSAKLKLLKAKSLTFTSQITQGSDIKYTLSGYAEEAANKIVEQLAVKSVAQCHAVKALITAKNKTLDPEQINKKKQIIAALFEYRDKELQFRQLETNVKAKKAEHAAVREEWYREIGELNLMRNINRSVEEIDTDNPIYLRLSKVVNKLEMMRWLLGKLVCSRGHRDWQTVPQRVCEMLKFARTPNTVAMFIED